MQVIDIIQIHQDILELFTKRKSSITELEEYIEKLKEYQDKTITHRINSQIENERMYLTQYVSDIKNGTSLNYYLMDALPLINEFKRIITAPMKASFMGKKTITNKSEKNNIIKGYLEINQKYKKIILTTPSKKNLVCIHCPNNKNFDIENNHYICADCGAQLYSIQNLCSYNAINRVNICSKYTYDRKVHFRDCINQFQGKQNSTIPESIYTYLLTQLKLHNLIAGSPPYPQITKQQIYLFLKDGGMSKFYEDLNLIHYKITGIKPPDVSHIEANLLADFDILTNLYDIKFRKNKKFRRKNFINTQYVLYQLLRKYNFPCKSTDFNILKTVERKSFHDDICRELFAELKWNFKALF